jgi:hypothetical protein
MIDQSSSCMSLNEEVNFHSFTARAFIRLMQYPTLALGFGKLDSERVSPGNNWLSACRRRAGGGAAALPWGRNCSKVVSREPHCWRKIAIAGVEISAGRTHKHARPDHRPSPRPWAIKNSLLPCTYIVWFGSAGCNLFLYTIVKVAINDDWVCLPQLWSALSPQHCCLCSTSDRIHSHFPRLIT